MNTIITIMIPMENQTPLPPPFLRDLEEGKPDSYVVTGEDLLQALQAMTPEQRKMRLWSGIDAGEGYLPLTVVTIENARWVDTDGDEHDNESDYIDPDKPKTGAILPEHTWREKSYDKNKLAVYRDILVIGNRRTLDDINGKKEYWIQSKRIADEKANAIIAKKAMESDPEFKKAKKAIDKLQKKYSQS